MKKKTLTQEDLDNDPTLIEAGYKVGDTLEVAEDSLSSDETTQDETDPPGGVEVPKKPPPPLTEPDQP